MNLSKLLSIVFVVLAMFTMPARADVTPENLAAAELAIKTMRAPELWMKQALKALGQNQSLGNKKAKIEKAFKAEMKKAMPKLVKQVAKAEAERFTGPQLFDIVIATKTKFMAAMMAASIDGAPRPKGADFPEDKALAEDIFKSAHFQTWLQSVSNSPIVVKAMALSIQAQAKKHGK